MKRATIAREKEDYWVLQNIKLNCGSTSPTISGQNIFWECSWIASLHLLLSSLPELAGPGSDDAISVCLVPQISIHRSWAWCVLLSWSGQASWSLASLLFFFLPSSLRELFSIVSFLRVYDRSHSFVLLGLRSSAIVVLLPSVEPAYLYCGPSSWSFPSFSRSTSGMLSTYWCRPLWVSMSLLHTKLHHALWNRSITTDRSGITACF